MRASSAAERPLRRRRTELQRSLPTVRRAPDLAMQLEAPPQSVTFASGGLSWTRVWLPRFLSRFAKALYCLYVLSVLGMLTGGLGAFGMLMLLSVFSWPLFIASYILSLTQTTFRGSLLDHLDLSFSVAPTLNYDMPQHSPVSNQLLSNRLPPLS